MIKLTRFLLAKTYFLLGDPNECILTLDKANLNEIDLSQETNRRNLKVYAEAFCLRGMCMSLVPQANGKIKRTERMERLMVNFEVANDISLKCGQINEMVMKDQVVELSPFQLSDLLESALARAPNMYAKHGMLQSALVRFRDTLRTIETPATRRIRLTLARQLLEMLLRGYLGVHYIGPQMTERQISAGTTDTFVVPRPKKYLTNGSFIPLAILEEVVLLLYICEAVIVRDLTNRPFEDHEMRKLLVTSSIAVADLGTIAFSRLYHISLGVPFLERSAKSCPNSSHIWKQFALNLIIKGDYAKGLHVLEQCFRFTPKDRSLLVFAAKVCVEYLFDLDRGVNYAENLVKMADKSRFTGRAHLILGVAYSLKALRIRDMERQAVFRGKAISFYIQAEADEPGEFLIQYHLALEYAMERRIDDAFKHVKKCLRMNMDFMPAHHLLALILSSMKRFDDALLVLEKAEIEFTEDIDMELTKIRLMGKVRGAEGALKSCRHLLGTWKLLYEKDLQDAERERLRTTSPDANYPVSPFLYNGQMSLSPVPPQYPTGGLGVTAAKISPSTPGISTAERAETLSYRADSSVTLPRTEGTMSEMASTTGSYLTKSSPHRAFISQLHVWILMADLYLSLEQTENALECLSEAASIGPPSCLIFHLQGTIILRNSGTFPEARKCFESALAINPWHAPSHIQIGRMQRKEHCHAEAERHFREALQGDPCCFEAWAALGELYIEKGNDDVAMEYLERARKMETSQPIQPFYNLPRCVSY